MKKIISSVLVILFVASFFAFFNTFSIKAKADSETNIYDETNTYNVDTDSIEKNVEKPGYEKGQYIIKYDMDNKKTDCLVAESPTVTVFTHGYNSSARDWLNNAADIEKEEYFTLQYSNESMVEQVINMYGGIENVILLQAQMTSYEKFDLLKIALKIEDGKICQDGNLSIFSKNKMVYGKHYIVIFDCLDGRRNDSNNNIYFQFNYMLSSVLYDLKQLDPSHRIPKVNLIGHSRGGLTNMQYALDHPDIVANLISLGTPYKGSTTATIVKNHKDFKGDGINDIINPDIYNGYKERWNNGYNMLYKDINFLAIGSYSTLPFFCKVAHNDRSGKMFNFWSALLVDAGTAVLTALDVATIGIGKTAIRIVTRILNEIFSQNVATSIAELLLNEVRFTEDGMVWLSDAIIPLESQLGLSYNGIKRSTKLFRLSGNYNLQNIAQWNAPAGHNLEPWDEEIINRVVEELKPSVTDGTENFKYKENANGTVSISGLKSAVESGIIDIPAAINGKAVTGISSGAFAGESVVISKLNAETTTNATNSEYNILSNITSINIPSSITEIGSEAFNGLKSLTTISFINNSQLQTIGANAFADCVNLKNISLPSGVTKIPYGAFENCKALESVTIPSGVTKIGAQAFCGAEKLSFTRLPASVTEIGELAFFGCKGSSSITLPSGVSSIGDGAFAGMENVTAFSVSGTNVNYTTENGVLYNKAKTELLQYPKAKTGASFIINGEDSANTVSKIKSYAFYKCENLTYVNINNVREIESLAFADCSALSRINAWGVNKASVDAFTNTSWLETQISDESCDQIVLDHILLLYIPEDKTEMGLSDWDSNIGTIGENAFAFSDLETIYVPSRVSRWSDNAFANIPTLKDVYIEKMDEDLLYKIGVQENLFGNNHADLKLHVTRSDNEAIAAMGQSALSDIPREVISTNVTCINNGVTTTQTIYYDEEYTLAGNGSVVWENEAGERYQNTGVWKRFETELTLNSLQVNNSWLTYNGENKSPVALVEGDVVSLSYTESGVVTATVNGQVYKINVSLVGRRISGFKMSGGQVVTSVNAVTYSGQFTSFNIETAVIDYELRCNYVYYYNSSSKRLYTENVSYTINKLDDVNEVMRLKNTIVSCKLANFDLDKEYYVEAFYSDYACTNQVTTPQLFNETLTDIYLKCTKIVTSVEFDYNGAKAKEIVRLKYYEFNASGKYNLTFPSYSKTGFTGSWQDVNSPDNKYACGSTKEINSNNNYNYKIFWTCSGEHSITINSTGDTQHKEKCSKCDYEAVSNHNIIIWGSTDDLFAHTRRCKKLCGYEEKEAHNWQPYNKMFKCTICNIKATTIPSIYDSLKFMIIDEQGNVKEISREEAMLIMKKYELEEEGDVAA